MIVQLALALVLQAGAALTPEQTAIRRVNMEMMERHYPRGSLKRGEEGAVGVSVTLDERGYPRNCVVTKTSGYRDLDSATCEVMVLYGRTKPIDEATRQVRTLAGEFNWTLPPGVARAKVAQANKRSAKDADRIAAFDPRKMICRTQTRTGSLAERRRTCMTAGEWMAQNDETQTEMREMQRRQAMNNN